MRRVLFLVVLIASLLAPTSAAPSLAQLVQFEAGDLVEVTDNDVNMRAEPNTTSPVVDTVSPGTVLRILSAEPVEADSLFWWNVSDDALGIAGWIAAPFLVPASVGPPIGPASESISAPPEAIPPASSEIELRASEFHFEPTTLMIDLSSGPVTIHFKNDGALTHHFHIDALGFDVEAAAGETVEIVIPASTKPGVYTFDCSVPGHKEAGMTGQLIVTSETGGTPAPMTSSNPTTRVFTTDCSGLEDYQADFQNAWILAVLSSQEVADLFLGETSNGGGVMIDTLTPEEQQAVSAMFRRLATELGLVTPPAYAATWHALQIESAILMSDYLTATATGDDIDALVEYGPQILAINQNIETAIENASACPDFVRWATEQSTTTLT